MSHAIRGKISATYKSESQAKRGAEALKRETALPCDAISVISPLDATFDDKLENRTHKVGFFMLKAHVLFALGGITLGLFSAVLLSFYGPTYTQSSPILTATALTVLGFFFGLMLAGFVSLRPDQDPVVNHTRAASKDGNWVVVVSSPSHQQTRQAREVLGQTAETVISSL